MKTSPSEKENNNQSSSPSSQNITEIPAIPIIRLTTPNDRKRKRTPQSIPRSATKRTKRSSDDPDLVQETRRQIFEDFGENVEAALVEEMLDFYDDFPDLIEEYRLVNKIGEGTFSSVYKAVDINHNAYDNEAWDRTGLSHVGSSGRKNQHFVAIKRIYVTSSPSRIHNELNILHRLSGHPNIIPIITARRRNDQVIAILPYFEHDDFRTYYRHMTILQIRQYMRSLLSALAHVHAEKIIHRDVKPSNFLYDPELGTGVLVDFGLAQDEPPALKKDAGKPPVGTKGINLEKAGKGGGKRIGYVVNDPRPSARANRAGTRGFRAPEVLFKVSHQTCSIDVWSAGVILLSLFSGQFPFFQSTDDGEALLEIACMFGKEAMQRVASRFKRTFETNIPDVGEQRSFEDICRKLYPRKAGEVPRAGWDLLRRLMALEPEERIGAKEAMKHEFFEGMG
ncbi:hypothetical protein HK097_010487 [Rhizophlyctis rosea]|uniref:non-specific serine/threonine protein kinase n=1 Tax=Rhizophlyctis rosea TaxID=64517 RepID=A0AAD5X0F4_9FUNG|nr:hypothetical protein HK097_010487 [Rhizophlyctis rosea]